MQNSHDTSQNPHSTPDGTSDGASSPEFSSPEPSSPEPSSPEPSSVSRRDFLLKVGALGLAGVGASAFLSGCSGDESGSADTSAGSGTGSSTTSADLRCDDVSSLSASEIERRNAQIDALEYVTETPNPEKNCANCLFWQEPAQGKECGGCQLFPGPVHPNGYCKTWQAQTG